MAAEKVALLVQDTTEIDLTRPEQAVEGAGELDGVRRGILLHDLQAFIPDGTPLGTAWAEALNRTEGVSHASEAEKRRQRKEKPIEEKESFRWLNGLREARKVAQELPTVQCICVADSEADIYEVFAEPRGEHPVHWLIRGCYDRATDGDGKRRLRDRVLAAPVLLRRLELLGPRPEREDTGRRSRPPTEPRVAASDCGSKGGQHDASARLPS